MKFALESPNNDIEWVQSLADFDFILAHQVLNNKVYADFYAASKRFKILDNGLSENKVPCSIEDLVVAANVVKPHFVIPPDHIRDLPRTVKAFNDAQEFFGFKKLLPVVQGVDYQEFVACANEFAALGCKTIAVPHRTYCDWEAPYEEMTNARVALVHSPVFRKFSWIHLLGMNSLEEFRYYKGLPNVRSVDTGVPWRCGAYGYQFGRDELPEKRPKIDYQGATGYLRDTVLYNIAYFRKLLS